MQTMAGTMLHAPQHPALPVRQPRCTCSTIKSSIRSPEALEKEQVPPLQVQEHLPIRPDKSRTGFKGVKLDGDPPGFLEARGRAPGPRLDRRRMLR